jgi:hypothetical protein
MITTTKADAGWINAMAAADHSYTKGQTQLNRHGKKRREYKQMQQANAMAAAAAEHNYKKTDTDQCTIAAAADDATTKTDAAEQMQ